MSRTWHLADSDATEAAGGLLAAALDDVAVIGLRGDLGAGKTTFARGFVATAAPDGMFAFSSPTWSIVNTCPGSPPVHHLDLYRLAGVDDLESVGFFELLDDIVLIEWPDRVAEALDEIDLVVTLDRSGAAGRTLALERRTPRGEAIATRFATALDTTD